MPKRRSLLALDWVNFFLADVETGVGPFMATFFASARHWDPAQIGLVLAAQKISSVLAQIPAGWAIDHSRRKHWLMAGTAAVIGCAAVLIAVLQSETAQIVNQMAVGIATAVATPLISAISLGMVGRAVLGRRIGRNGSLSHFGNLLTASFAGYLGYAAGLQWIFYVSGALGILCTLTALLIRGSDIDNGVARGAAEEMPADAAVAGFAEVLRRPFVPIFALTVVLFHIANAAMLPLAGQELPGQAGRSSSVYMSACIVTAQAVMIPVAYGSGRLADRIGRKRIFTIGFAALVLRGILFASTKSPDSLVAIEALDGIGTGISGVLTVLVVSDLAKGTGRFNFLQGVVQACLGTGSFLGNLLGGFAAKAVGFPATFAGLACVALTGMVLFVWKMPETSQQNIAESDQRHRGSGYSDKG